MDMIPMRGRDWLDRERQQKKIDALTDAIKERDEQIKRLREALEEIVAMRDMHIKADLSMPRRLTQYEGAAESIRASLLPRSSVREGGE